MPPPEPAVQRDLNSRIGVSDHIRLSVSQQYRVIGEQRVIKTSAPARERSYLPKNAP